MTDRCSVCGVTAAELAQPWGALLHHTVRIQRRRNPVVRWVTCSACELKEMKNK